MARTTGRSGFKLRSGNNSSFKDMGSLTGANKELVEIAQGFVKPVEEMDIDYGGGFDMHIDVSGTDPSGESKPKDDPYTSGIDPSNKSGKVQKNVGGKITTVKARDRFKDDPNRRVPRKKDQK